MYHIDVAGISNSVFVCSRRTEWINKGIGFLRNIIFPRRIASLRDRRKQFCTPVTIQLFTICYATRSARTYITFLALSRREIGKRYALIPLHFRIWRDEFISFMRSSDVIWKDYWNKIPRKFARSTILTSDVEYNSKTLCKYFSLCSYGKKKQSK